ncbi:MAG TPA: flagellin [Xanthobacteraceae bacterium]|jgi:flagellin-like hook-associated protein FlgL
MAMDVSLTSAARQSLLSLQDISNQMSVLQKRLATGKRVNTPIDDPITYFTWSALSSRAASLDTVLTGITGAQSTIQAANKGLAALQSLISSAQSLANQAQQSPNTLVKVTGTNSTALTTASVIATTAGAANRFKAGDTLTVSDGTTTATYTAANNDTVQTIMTAINGTAGLKAAVTLNASGQLQIAATNTVNIAIGGTLTGAGTLTGIVGLTAGTTSFVANPTRQSLAAQYDVIRTQIDQAVGDASFNGQNLISGSTVSVNFNETGTSKLTITGSQLSSGSLGLTASVNQWQVDGDITTALNNLTTAASTVQAQAASLSASQSIFQARQDFTKGMRDTVKTGADDLVAADTNEDGAALLALQTRQQIAATSLSMANSAHQATLRLFGF